MRNPSLTPARTTGRHISMISMPSPLAIGQKKLGENEGPETRCALSQAWRTSGRACSRGR